MLRKQQKLKNIVFLTIFSIIFIGIGYSIISTNLNIKGNLDIGKITWDVHFENFIELEDNTVKVTSYNIYEDKTTLNYSVKLNKPGDKYSFTIDVVNNGTIDAMIASLGSNGLTDNQKIYLDYSITYIDGNSPKEKDALPVGDSETFLVTIKAKADIDNSQLSSSDETLTLKLQLSYVQDDNTSVSRPSKLYDIIKKNAVLDNIKSSYVSSDAGINYSLPSSDENGKGIYLKAETKNEKNPIYYYRGAVENNNVIFGNYCWKIVRTTDTGGVKMIFNGTDTDGTCIATQSDAVLTFSPFSLDVDSIGYSGYMNGEISKFKIENANLFAESATFNNGLYTLKQSQDTLDQNHHYSCGDSSNDCSTLRYYYYVSKTDEYYYVELKNGDLIDNLIEKMLSNQTDSILKDYIENTWYFQNMLNYTPKLEDTVYCDDRNIYKKGGWSSSDGNIKSYLYFNAIDRMNNKAPSLECERREDQFTVSKSNGNGQLKYPVGLLTPDETMLAGGIPSSTNNTYYLYNKTNYWLLSGYDFDYDGFDEYVIESNGQIERVSAEHNYGVRPVISLKHNITFSSGNGTKEKPYIV